MKLDRNSLGEIRQSALWGKKGSRGARRSAPRARGFAATLVLVLALAIPVAATAASGGNSGQGGGIEAFVPDSLLEKAQANPAGVFKVVVQGQGSKRSADVAKDVAAARAQVPGKGAGVTRKFATVQGVAAELTGKQILKLAAKSGIFAITEDAKVALAGYSSDQVWPAAAGVTSFWTSATAVDTPAIAVVDSGVEASRADFGGRVVAQVDMTALEPDSPGDGRGHGTLVASIAAGEAPNRAGAAPQAKIVSIDVMNDLGMAMTSDVIAAADWILANKAKYNIRVANFSLHSTVPASFMFDPLDKAVEKLWFSGVVVVAAAGNYAQDGAPSGVLFAPGNDPFVITVGAADPRATNQAADDLAAPWSAHGYTLDGFAKPELSAPGRYMVGAVPATSTMALERPDRLVGLLGNYMWMSGTSFAAPVVSGTAAALLARHPHWTPDQVKGALMLSARTTSATGNALGVGEVHGGRANQVDIPPNANEALSPFVTSDPAGGPVPVFDAASWASVAQADASWASASWASASWASASWASASWASASWASASWASASWAADAEAAASWAAASWAAASWSSASWAAASWVS